MYVQLAYTHSDVSLCTSSRFGPPECVSLQLPEGLEHPVRAICDLWALSPQMLLPHETVLGPAYKKEQRNKKKKKVRQVKAVWSNSRQCTIDLINHHKNLWQTTIDLFFSTILPVVHELNQAKAKLPTQNPYSERKVQDPLRERHDQNFKIAGVQ